MGVNECVCVHLRTVCLYCVKFPHVHSVRRRGPIHRARLLIIPNHYC